MNYNLTLQGYFENMTSGQGHDLSRKGHVAYQSIRMVGLNTSMVFSVKKNKAKQKRAMWAPCGLHVGQLGIYLKCDQYRLTVRRMWATQRFVF